MSEHEPSAGDMSLERRLHRELLRLPVPRAPRTLLPRVIAAVDRPWYARAWRTWPVAAQAASLVMTVLLLVSTSWLLMSVEALSAGPDLIRIGWRLLVQPAVLYVFAVAVAFSLTAAASWAALTRVALGETE